MQIDGSERVQTFTYTGSDQRYTVPDGTAQLHVRMWGAGGGGGGRTTSGYGGSGGYTESTITLPSGTTTLAVVVGEGGTWCSSVEFENFNDFSSPHFFYVT